MANAFWSTLVVWGVFSAVVIPALLCITRNLRAENHRLKEFGENAWKEAGETIKKEREYRKWLREQHQKQEAGRCDEE